MGKGEGLSQALVIREAEELLFLLCYLSNCSAIVTVPEGTLVKVWRIFGCHNLGWGTLLASNAADNSWDSPLQHEPSSPKVNVAKVEKP